MTWQKRLESKRDLSGVFEPSAHYTAGFPVGIIAVDLLYPKMPGNVANATTYPFPVLYKKVSFEIERLFEGDCGLEEEIVNAAKELESEGVRAIVGACGYFVHFQRAVAEAVNVPVFLSSLCQLPMIKLSVSEKKNILILAASGEHIDEKALSVVGVDNERIIVRDIGSLPAFSPIRYGKKALDNGKLTEELCRVVTEELNKNPNVGAILLECSDLPPYASAIQSVCGLPVFDFNTMIDLIYHSVVQKTYYGYL